MESEKSNAIRLAARRAFVAHSLSCISETVARLQDTEANTERLLDDCARLLHTVKGGAGFVGYRHIAEIASDLERHLRLAADKGVVRAPFLGQGLERLFEILKELEASQQECELGPA